MAAKYAIDISYAPASEFEQQVREEFNVFQSLTQELGLKRQ
jgi:hypothetical protein